MFTICTCSRFNDFDPTPPLAEILFVKNVRAFVFCGFLIKEIYAENMKKKIMGAVWNPQTTNALTFLTHNISALGGVTH